MSKNLKNIESGRSMVEMLGVLAIIGVLSVGGIAGYTMAMNKHKANELLNEASKRAVVVSGHLLSGKAGSIAEFTDPSGYKFEYAAVEGQNQFKLTLKTSAGVKIDESICAQIKNVVGGEHINPSVNDDCTELTYNNDLGDGSAEAGSEGNEPSIVPELTCDEGATPQNGICVCANGVLYGSSYRTEDKCGMGESTYTGCKTNSDCTTAGTFCYIASRENLTYDFDYVGSCKNLSDYPGTPVEYEGHNYIKLDEVNMWTAYNYCQAKGLPQASWDDFKVITPGACKGEIDCSCKAAGCDCFSKLRDAFGGTIYTSNSTTIGSVGCGYDVGYNEDFVPANKWTAVCKTK